MTEGTTVKPQPTSNGAVRQFTAICRLTAGPKTKGITMSSDVFDKDIPATVENLLREVSKIKSTVTEAVDDGVKSAVRTLRQGRDTAEDMIDDARRTVKRNPLQTVAAVFAVGVLAGCVFSLFGRRSCSQA